MFAFPFWFLYELAYEHSEAHILKMCPSVWVRYLYRSAQKNSGYVTDKVKMHRKGVTQKNLNKSALMINYFTCNFLSSWRDVSFILQWIFSKSSINSAFDVFSLGSYLILTQYPDLNKRKRHKLRSSYYLKFKM